VCGEHLAGYLGVSGLVCAYQTELVTAEDGDQAVEQKKAGYGEEDNELSHCVQAWQPLAKPKDGWVVDSFAGRGRLLTIVHLSVHLSVSFIRAERDKAIRVLSGVG
jgi:hypothetical protein